MAMSCPGVISPPGIRGHHRVGAVALDVGEEVVVGVLQRRLLAVEDVAVDERGEDRRHRRLADLAAAAACRGAASSSANDAEPCTRDEVEQLLAGAGRSARTARLPTLDAGAWRARRRAGR